MQQSLRATIGPLQTIDPFFSTSLESQESLLTTGMCYLTNMSLDHSRFFRLHSTFARLYNAAASPASGLRSAGSLATKRFNVKVGAGVRA